MCIFFALFYLVLELYYRSEICRRATAELQWLEVVMLGMSQSSCWVDVRAILLPVPPKPIMRISLHR